MCFKFIDEIKFVINGEFECVWWVKFDEECMICLCNLQVENSSLFEQSWQFQIGYVKLYVQIKYVRDEDWMVGYVILGIKVVLVGMQGVFGFVLIFLMIFVGVFVGVILIVDLVNMIICEVGCQFLNEFDMQGMFGDGVMNIVKFMGFE